MKSAKLVFMTAVVFCLTVAVTAQQPQRVQPQSPQQQVDQDRTEAAHSELLNAKDKAAEASRLTQAVSPALPATAVSNSSVRIDAICLIFSSSTACSTDSGEARCRRRAILMSPRRK